MANGVLSTYRGSLDFLEYCIDPGNHDTSYPGGIGVCVCDYLQTLGLSEEEVREWILEKLREERKSMELIDFKRKGNAI